MVNIHPIFLQIFLDDINLERCFPDGEWTKVVLIPILSFVTDMITYGEWVKGISYSKTKIVFTNNAELNFIFLGEIILTVIM